MPGNPQTPQSVALALPHCRATVAPHVRDALLPLLLTPPGQWLAGSDRELVKQTTVRAIVRCRLAGLDVHGKLYRAGRLSDRARDALGGARGERERDNLLAARALSLPAVEPLAAGVFPGDADWHSFLITATVADARPFTFAADAAVIERVGRLLRRCHDLGCLPADLHSGNLVLDGAAAPWLLDLTAVRARGEAGLEGRARALAFFCQALDGGPLDRAAKPLLAGYCAAGALPASFRRKLGQAANAVRLHALAAFGRRATRECKHTHLDVGGRGQAWWALHQSGDAAGDERLHAAARAFAAAPPPPLKTGRRGAVWLLPGLAVKQRPAATARRLFKAHYWLLFAGVPQAAPVALREHRGVGFAFAARVAGDDLAASLRRRPWPATAAVAAARGLGNAVGRLHAHGLRNRDLKFENLVVDGATGELRLVDLDGVRRKKPTDPRGQGADLGRLFAAFVAAGQPGGELAMRAFLRGYARARRRLLQPAPLRRLLRTAGQRARAWASAHAR